MSNYVVVNHHLDEAAGVYRLTVGEVIEHEVIKLDAAGEPVMQEVQAEFEVEVPTEIPSVTNGDGPIEAEAPEPTVETATRTVLVPIMERVQETVVTEDFVFAADDERWEGMLMEDVAAAQRQIVADALAAREKEAQKAARRRAKSMRAMPGTGEAL